MAPATPQSSGLVAGDATSGAYVLGRDDVVQFSLVGRTEWGGRVRVQEDGTLQLPLIGTVQASNRTAAELAQTVRQMLQAGGYYADPIVNVEVVSYASRYVVVLGAVAQPGLIPINRPYRLSEIVARVGGVRDGAADYLVVRSDNGTEKHFVISELATGGDDKDPYVMPGDKIYAPAAELFYVYGAVKSPGAFPMTGGATTVRMAIAKAGGVTENGSDKKVQVTRGGKKITVDANATLEPRDVVFVKERLF
jgi:polysaccharide export outer membrane protein